MPSSRELGLDTPRDRAFSIALVFFTVFCFQFGSALAKSLFAEVGPLGTSVLRMGLASIPLLALAPPRVAGLRRTDWLLVMLFGLCIAGMNGCFYVALRTIPLGLAVTFGFLGPLGVAVAHSNRLLDYGWVGLAALGILLLMPVGPLAGPLDLAGVGWVLLSALGWAFYILCGQRLGRTMPLGQLTALGTSIAALVMAPFGIAEGGSHLLSPAVLPLALVLALVSTALPFRLEMITMQRLPPKVFGILMSLEPAIAALYGWLMLGETLGPRDLVGMACVVAASAGVTWSGGRAGPPPAL